jgi:flagellar biosynthesis protein FlhF
LSSLYQRILLQEVDRGIASELIEEVKRIPAAEDLLANGDIKSHLSAILEDMGVMVDQKAIVDGKQTIMAFVGTTGVGKTTTVAKLAALQSNQSKKSVGLITIDNYSIAAMQQLDTYAQIIGLPLVKAVNAGELKKALKKFKDKDIILIDTPGINPQVQEQIQDLKAFFSKTTGVQTQLVLSATTKEKDCIAISEAFRQIGVHSILFTKTDESSVFGNIVNVLIRTGMPLSFLCGGRHVPDDIEAATVPRLINLLFRSNSSGGYGPYRTAEPKTEIDLKKENQTDQQPYFVANKNSDVYHCTACKWAKKIKPGNIINFADAHQAEAQNFLPCRSCNPDRDQGVNRSYSKTEMKQHSNYR